jgi:predicted aconitase
VFSVVNVRDSRLGQVAVNLTTEERAIAAGARGDGAAMAMRIVAETAR